MKQPIDLNQQDLNNMAQTADELFDWLQESTRPEAEEGKRINIPHHLSIVATVALVYGIPLIFDPLDPSTMCWFGGCTL